MLTIAISRLGGRLWCDSRLPHRGHPIFVLVRARKKEAPAAPRRNVTIDIIVGSCGELKGWEDITTNKSFRYGVLMMVRREGIG